VQPPEASDWASWVGRTSTSSVDLDPALANRMAVTLDRAPTFNAGDELPPAWHWLYFHDVIESSRLGADGHPALGIVMPPVPLARRMWAAGSIAFDHVLRLGQSVTRVSRIDAITPKEGRTGPLCFVTVEHEISAGETLAVRETQTIVYRDLTADPAGVSVKAPEDAEFGRRWTLNSTALFRYSALTFNGHRIHYDLDYAQGVEGYPGLVIHGPLLATLLADLASGQDGRIATFDYRARSPLFVPGEFSVNGRKTKDGADLWAASEEGVLAMDATVSYDREAQ
jgi:3-methylfumaryl-CoA hydratase